MKRWDQDFHWRPSGPFVLARISRRVPTLDIVIDDGGHEPEQQIASLEELLPFLQPGGAYFCEDVHGMYNEFASYVHGLGHKLNDTS
jgi:hypothetical protein